MVKVHGGWGRIVLKHLRAEWRVKTNVEEKLVSHALYWCIVLWYVKSICVCLFHVCYICFDIFVAWCSCVWVRFMLFSYCCLLFVWGGRVVVVVFLCAFLCAFLLLCCCCCVVVVLLLLLLFFPRGGGGCWFLFIYRHYVIKAHERVTYHIHRRDENSELPFWDQKHVYLTDLFRKDLLTTFPSLAH